MLEPRRAFDALQAHDSAAQVVRRLARDEFHGAPRAKHVTARRADQKRHRHQRQREQRRQSLQKQQGRKSKKNQNQQQPG